MGLIEEEHVKKQMRPREIRRRDLVLTKVIGTGAFGEVYKVQCSGFTCSRGRYRMLRLRLQRSQCRDPTAFLFGCPDLTVTTVNCVTTLKATLDESERRNTPEYTVAAKTVLDAKNSPEATSELLAEASVMAQVGSHPNLVSLIGVVTRGDPMVLVLSYCRYEPLPCSSVRV
jgi:serine/threonine protein kinase